MKKLLAAAAAITLALGLSACASGPVIAPVTVEVGDLQGTTVELITGQVLNINTGSLEVDSYTASVADPSIAEFSQGYTDGSATFNPGFEAKKVGQTEVTLTNEQGGIQSVEFTINVTK